jgi:phosphoglycerate kinase
MSGMKISSKLPTLKKMLAVADKVMIAGGLGVSCYKALGYETGLIQISDEDAKLAKSILKKKNLMIPKDVVVTTHPVDKGKVRVTPVNAIRKDEEVMDLGPETIRAYAEEIKKAQTIAWNGPVGHFEVKTFSHGTMALGMLIAARSKGRAFGVAGGGETVAALAGTKMSEWMDHISTGGGAMLEFLEGKTLPGIKPLLKK